MQSTLGSYAGPQNNERSWIDNCSDSWWLLREQWSWPECIQYDEQTEDTSNQLCLYLVLRRILISQSRGRLSIKFNQDKNIKTEQCKKIGIFLKRKNILDCQTFMIPQSRGKTSLA